MTSELHGEIKERALGYVRQQHSEASMAAALLAAERDMAREKASEATAVLKAAQKDAEGAFQFMSERLSPHELELAKEQLPAFARWVAANDKSSTTG